MAKFSDRPDTCPSCRLQYKDMKTNLTFELVRRELKGRKFVVRSSVLGFWRELKMNYWDAHLGQCR